MRKQWLLLVFFATCTILLLYTACTYDYFEDESNYVVYVPEVKDKTVADCRVMIYDKSGLLVGDKSTTASKHDPRLNMGLFAFRLPVGEYKVYCYANTDSILFSGANTYETSAFSLPGNSTEGVYSQPSDVFYDRLEHTVEHPGALHSDTAVIERYVGHITVRFKNFPYDLADLSGIDMVAEGIASRQYLKHDTLTSRIGDGDVMKHTNDLSSISLSGGILEVDHRYFPSLENSRMALHFTFTDSGRNAITEMTVAVSDPDTNIPVRLYRGKRIIIEVDRYYVTTVQLVGWDEDIESGEDIGVW
ncbi:MAG: FimB/Mfa2 family fimbrial subunit [Mediterranea sp.]|jgi:hypothetical protein|nr:FimB/Mfa2 family fimbrial subunit [Mediterranea sp.]